jgi:hypothetical protein
MNALRRSFVFLSAKSRASGLALIFIRGDRCVVRLGLLSEEEVKNELGLQSVAIGLNSSEKFYADREKMSLMSVVNSSLASNLSEESGVSPR